MPSPLGHTIISSSAYLFFNRNFSLRRDWQLMLSFIFIGLLPDIDLLLVLVKKDIDLHRSVTHNFLFVILAALIISLFFKRMKAADFKKTFLLVLALLLLHVIADFFTIDEIIHNGINLFYPITKEYLPAPFYLFMGFDWRKPAVFFSPHMLNVWLREFIITVPLLAIALIFQQKSDAKKVA